MPLRKKEISRLYYRIGEVAELFHVNTSLIRFYEKEFDIISPHRNKKGNRLFTQNDVDNFHTIFHLIKDKGYTLEGAKAHLRKKNIANPDSQEIIRSLQRVKRFLLEIRNDLE
jgi:DNA-binding transcriptional MerR regulator